MSITKHEDKYFHITKSTAVAIGVGIPWAYIAICGIYIIFGKLHSLNINNDFAWFTLGGVLLIALLIISIIVIPLYIALEWKS